jgi:hypothetical protein
MKHTTEHAAAYSRIVARLVGREITYSPETSSVDKSPHPSRTFNVISLERFFYSPKFKNYGFTAKVIDIDDGNTEKFRSFNLSLVS